MQSPSKKRCRVTCSRGMREKTASSLPRRSSTEGDPFSAVDPACSRAPDHRSSRLLPPRWKIHAQRKFSRRTRELWEFRRWNPRRRLSRKRIRVFIHSYARETGSRSRRFQFPTSWNPCAILSFLPDFRRSDSRIRNAIGFKSEVQDRCWSNGRSG